SDRWLPPPDRLFVDGGAPVAVGTQTGVRRPCSHRSSSRRRHPPLGLHTCYLSLPHFSRPLPSANLLGGLDPN
uniref:Uncharacterized protein n=1 Tax=Aegilops tauschii subsp. strangulata TaxID=200361 RepID=A0A453AWQ9_AEGTS